MTRKFLPVALIILLSFSILLIGCSEDTTAPTTDATIKSLEGGELTDVEIEDLLFMREEEKLARDVYIAMGDLYGLDVFANIQLSEQQHTDAILALLNNFDLEDPVGDNGIGEFTDHHLQELYDGLVADGAQSMEDALLVGLAIEEIDMIDIVEAMHRSDTEAILTTYDNLLEGSKDHLRAFVGVYEEKIGETYVPRFITQAFYDEIMDRDDDDDGETDIGRGRNMSQR